MPRGAEGRTNWQTEAEYFTVEILLNLELSGQAGGAQAQQETDHLDRGPTHRHLGRTRSAAREAVTRTEAV